jgi:hypothetical protein
MAALNMTNELLHGGGQAPAVDPEQNQRLRKLEQKIDDVLHQCRQLPL